MGDLFKTKVRNVGTSLGVLIPKEVAKEMNVKEGETVKVGILKENKKNISRLFGKSRGSKPFKREHRDREF